MHMSRGTCFILLAMAFSATPARAQAVQYRSPAGVEYRSQPDSGTVAEARQALDADPGNVDLVIALGVAQSGVRQYREAIETFTRGMAIAPANPLLYRWRGHRYLSVRELDRARSDLEHGLSLDSTLYGALYHLGIVHYLRGEFDAAAKLFERGQAHAPDPGELAGSTDWRWMSLMRAGHAAEAKAMLDAHPDSLATTVAYAQRLKLYRGEIEPEALIGPADTADVQLATLAYGLGDWYLLRGDTAKARASFERSVRSGGWPAFGFMAAEADLRRMR